MTPAARARLVRFALAALVTTLALTGCSARVYLTRRSSSLLDHAVFIGSDGTPALMYDNDGHSLNTSSMLPMQERVDLQPHQVRPDNDTWVASLDRFRHLNYDYQAYVHRIIEALRRQRKADAEAHRTTRVVIYIHGGRNALAGARENAAAIMREMSREAAERGDSGRTRLFPIFINYESADLSSYLEHLRNPRPERRNPLEEAWTLLRPPVRLVADVGGGVARIPLTLDQEIVREYATLLPQAGTSVLETRGPATTTPRRGGRWRYPDSLHVEYGGFEETGLTRGYNATVGLLAAPIRMAFGLLISTAAPGEWESMRRRSEFALRPPDEFSRDHWKDGPTPMSGAVGILLDSLSRGGVLDSNLTLIGHSTGTIVATEILRLHPGWDCRDVVFMGAACTIREFESSVLPYLASHPQARFFNLCLHPVAELRETCMPLVGQFIYRGSLLTWIDDYLDAPLGPVDRTMGRAENCLAAQHGWPDTLRSQIYIRVAPFHPSINDWVSRERVPIRRHSEFARPSNRFWNESFWWPAGADRR